MGQTGDEQLLCGMQKLEAVVLMGPRLPGVAAALLDLVRIWRLARLVDRLVGEGRGGT